MSQSTEELEEQLDSAASHEKKIALLHQLSRELYTEDPERALLFAKQSLTLAASRRQRREEAVSYRYIGAAHLLLSQYGAALVNLRRACRLFLAVGDELGRALALANIGALHYQRGEYRGALDVLHEALEIGERHQSSTITNMALTNLGVIYRVLGDYSRALDYHHRSMRIKEGIGIGPMFDLNNMGALYFEMENFPRALQCYQHCLELHRNNGERYGEALSLLNISLTSQSLGDLVSAQQHLLEALALFREIGDRGRVATVLQSLSTYHRKRGDLDLASYYLADATRIAVEIESQPVMLEILFEESYIMRASGEHRRAIDLLEDALQRSCAAEVRAFEMNAHQHLTDLYEETGEIARAFSHHKQYAAIKEELLSLEKQKAVNEMEIRIGVERAREERAILRLQNERLQMETAIRSRELTTLAMQIVQKNEFLEMLNHQVRELTKGVVSPNQQELLALQQQIDGQRRPASQWETFEQQFHALHPGFIEHLSTQYPALWPAELKVCALLKLKMSTKDVAGMLRCSTRTVEDSRYRIRTKLGLGKEVNLSSYLAGI